jgi:hypothetical protein
VVFFRFDPRTRTDVTNDGAGGQILWSSNDDHAEPIDSGKVMFDDVTSFSAQRGDEGEDRPGYSPAWYGVGTLSMCFIFEWWAYPVSGWHHRGDPAQEIGPVRHLEYLGLHRGRSVLAMGRGNP